ncbi:MAG: hypothetical protein LC775_01825, partial [Acidobacteria bacterium]|nr:hypothetical protein [Acidobacteriota bacterium]
MSSTAMNVDGRRLGDRHGQINISNVTLQSQPPQPLACGQALRGGSVEADLVRSWCPPGCLGCTP